MEILETKTREPKNKSAARQIRREGSVPSVVYGHGTEPQHISVDAHAIELIARKENALLKLEIAKKKTLVMIKDVQRNVLKRTIEHVDFLIVSEHEKLDVEIALYVEGEPIGSGIAEILLDHIPVKAPADNIPEKFVINVDKAPAGTHYMAKDIDIPKGIELEIDGETVVALIEEPKGAASQEASEEAAAE